MNNKDKNNKYSTRAEQIGNNVIKKSKLASKYTRFGLAYIDTFMTSLLSLKPKEIHFKDRKKRGVKKTPL